VLSGIAALTLTLVTAIPAQAVTYNGQINCTGTPYTPRLSLNVTASGNGTWTNYNNAGQNTAFNFPGGASVRYAPYIRTFWAVSAAGFYSAPTQACA
jgi:hypothetical protein